MKRYLTYLVVLFLTVMGSCFLLACTPKFRYKASLDALLEIVPGQTSESDIRGILGEPDEIVIGVLDRYWDYFAPDNQEVRLRIFFDLETEFVDMVVLYDSALLVQDLLNQFGNSPLVFQVDSTENFGSDVYLTQFAYPEQGIYADVYNPLPDQNDPLYSIWKQVPIDAQEYRDLIESSTQKQIIDWP